jgi:hypothetical protein
MMDFMSKLLYNLGLLAMLSIILYVAFPEIMGGVSNLLCSSAAVH